MGRTCCVCGAAATKEAATVGIHFVRFPTRKDLRQKWIEAIDRDNFRPKPNSVLCSRHFDRGCFEQRKGGVRLTPGSFPTIFNLPSEEASSHQNESAINNNVDGKQSTTQASQSGKVTDGQKQKFPRSRHVSGADEDGQFRTLCDTSVEILDGDISLDGASSEDLSPPVLRPVNELNSDFEEDVRDPPDLDCPFPPIQDSDPDFADMPEVDSSQVEIIGSVGDFFDTDSLPLFNQPSESPSVEVRPKRTCDDSMTAERDEVDGQTILSFASFEDLETFATHQSTSVTRRPKKTDDVRLIKGWRNKLHRSSDDLETEEANGSSRQPASEPVEFMRLNPGETISAAFAKYAASAVPSVLSASDNQSVALLPETHSEPVAMSRVEIQEQIASPAVVSRRGNKTKAAERRSAIFDSSSPPSKRKASDNKETFSLQLEPEDSVEPVLVEEPYEEYYDVPGAGIAGRSGATDAHSCDKLFCRLGCICDSLAVPKSDMEHCNRAECMLHCVCGYRKDKSCRRNNTFYKLLKGNESYYSKIDWSSKRQRRERKLPERFRDSVFHHDTDFIVSRVINEEKSRLAVRKNRPSLPSPRIQSISPRTSLSSPHPSLHSPRMAILGAQASLESPQLTPNSTPRAPASSPRLSVSSPRPVLSSPRSANKVVSPQSVGRPPQSADVIKRNNPTESAEMKSPIRPAHTTPIIGPARRKRQPFRVKIFSDEMKFLRWGSYVQLHKEVVSPKKKIYCMEHECYDCPCLELNRRIIRIADHFTPPRVSFNHRPRNVVGNDPSAGTSVATEGRTSQGSTQVAHPSANDRTLRDPPACPNGNAETSASVRGIAPLNDSSAEEVCNVKATGEATGSMKKPIGMANVVDSKRAAISAVSKMTRLVQGERFRQLILQEKMRIFDEDLDLTIRSGETVELIAWIRFHRIYQAGKIHIRVLIRRTGPMILVMRPNEIVAEDITTDIQDLRDDPTAPEIVRELLDPYISAGETTRYALLLCDGVKWELVSCLTPSPSAPEPVSPPQPAEKNDAPPSQSRPSQTGVRKTARRMGPKSKMIGLRSPDNSDVTKEQECDPVVTPSREEDHPVACNEDTMQEAPPDKPVANDQKSPKVLTPAATAPKPMQLNRLMSGGKVITVAQLAGALPPKSRTVSGPIITSVTSGSQEAQALGSAEKSKEQGIIRIKEEPGTESTPPTSSISDHGAASQPTAAATTNSALPRQLTLNYVGTLMPSTSQTTSTTTTSTASLSNEQRLKLLTKLVQVSQPTAGDGNTNASTTRIVKIPSALLTGDRKMGDMTVVRLKTALANSLAAKPNGTAASTAPQALKTFSRSPQPSAPRALLPFVPLKGNSASLTLASFAASAASAASAAGSAPFVGNRGSTAPGPSNASTVSKTPAARVITLTSSPSAIPSVSAVSASSASHPPAVPAKTVVVTAASISGTQRPAASTPVMVKAIRAPLSSVIPLARAQTAPLPGAQQPRAALGPGSGNVRPLKIVITKQRLAPFLQGASRLPSISNPPAPTPALAPTSSPAPAHDPTLLPLTPMPSADISLSLPNAADDVTVLSDDCPSPNAPDPTLLPDCSSANKDISFPTPTSATVSCVQLPTGSWSRRLKIIYNLDNEQQRNAAELKTPTTVLLPLQNEDDQWCIVAIDHVPASGLEIPASNISIPQSILEQAAQTACARNFRVSFPLHVIGGHHCPIPQKGFGVYGIPNLPSHVFLGPFTRDYLTHFDCSSIPYVMHIQTASPPVYVSNLNTNRGLQQIGPAQRIKTEKDAETGAVNRRTSQTESDVEVDSDESDLDSSEEFSIVPDDRKPVTDIIYGCQAGIKGQEWYRSGSNILTSRKTPLGVGGNQSSDELEIIKDIHLATREGRLPKMRHLSVDQLPAKPERVSVVRVPGLPPTTMSVLDDDMIVVKNPLNSEESVRFSSIEEGKDWLKSLSMLARTLHVNNSNSNSRPSSASRESSNEEPVTSKERYKPGPKSRKNGSNAPNITIKPDVRSSPVRSEDSNNSNPESPASSRGVRSGQQHILHNRRERERRGVMAHRLRELGMILTDTEGEFPMTKLSVLQHATTAIKALESTSKEMKTKYLKLKSERRTLIARRKQIYSSLPSELKNVFQDLTENAPLPESHKNVVMKSEKCDDGMDDVNEDESGTHIDIEIESDLYGDFNDFLEVDVVTVDEDEPKGKSLNIDWSSSPTRKN